MDVFEIKYYSIMQLYMEAFIIFGIKFPFLLIDATNAL